MPLLPEMMLKNSSLSYYYQMTEVRYSMRKPNLQSSRVIVARCITLSLALRNIQDWVTNLVDGIFMGCSAT